MAPMLSMNRPVRPRLDTGEEEDLRPDEQSGSDDTSSDNGRGISSEGTNDEFDDIHEGQPTLDSEGSVEDGTDLKDISFGVLVKAQETFAPPSRKRKLPAAFEDAVISQEQKPDTKFEREKRPDSKPYQKPASRSSKHAPTVQSSRHEVSRRREIFEPSPSVKSRDPRFDPAISASSNDMNAADRANKNYSFLSTYQATEILDLKSQIKKSKDPDAVAQLKRQVMSIESKVRNADSRQREKDIMRKHNDAEKQAIRTGQKSKPYYLKESEVKKMANTERLAGMGKRARDKAEERKRKREKGKEAKHMPRVRREG